MAKNLSPIPPAEIHQAPGVGLNKSSARAMPDPTAERTAGTTPTDKGQQGLKSGTVNARQARKKSGLPNELAEAGTESLDASSSLETAKLEASGAELSAYGAQQATVFGEPLVLAQALVDAPSTATLSSASANASAATAASASSIGAGGFMALAGMALAVSQLRGKEDSLVAPTINIITGNNVINAAEVHSVITGTNETGATVKLSIGGETRAATVIGNTWSYTLVDADITAMGEGAETLNVVQTNASGRVSPAALLAITVDTVLPTAPTIDAIAVDNIINATEVGSLITGTNDTGAAVTLSIAGISRAASVNGAIWRYTLVDADLSAMGQGAETLLVTQTDAAGNTSPAATLDITVDTLAPTLAITSNKEALKAGETATITFTFSKDPATSFAWNGTTGDIAVTGGTLSEISGSGLTRTATFTPTASLASGSASITVAGASYLDAAGNSGGAGTSPSISLDTLATTPLSLVVQDGYLNGAEVWVDMNDNGVIDTLVDFKFGLSINGKVDGALTDAQKLHALITTGGTDISTGLAFQGSYSATAGSTVVNPLTSLVQSMVQSSMGSTAGMTDAQKLARITEVKAEALAAVNSALGLPVGADLTRIDIISTATASTGDLASGISLEQALEINSKALMVANMMAMGAAALQGASTSSGGVPSMSTFSNFIVQGIVDAITTAAASGETVALGDSNSLTSILGSASTAATAAGSSFALDSTKLSAANAAVATSVASTNSLITTLTGNAIAANAINPGSATGALTQMLAAQKAVLNQLDELQANNVSVLNTFSDVGAVFTASQSAENTAGLKLGTQTVTAPVIEEDNSHGTVTAVTVKPVKAGDLAQFVVKLSEGVFVQATGQNKPTIAIQNTATSEAIATYDPGLSGGDKLVFTYRVKDGDTLLGVALGTSIQLPDGSLIMDLARNKTNLSLNSGLQNFQAAEVVGRTLDNLAPTLSITSNKEALKAGETATITFTFSEDPGISFAWTGSEGDVVVTGGTLSAASDTGLVRTATFTPTADLDSASASITVAGSSFLDAAGNNGNTESTAAISIDTLAPVANFSAIKNSLGSLLSAGPTNSASLQLSGSNEAGASVSVYNGSTLLGLADVIETVWTYSISTEEGSTYDLRVQETDAAGNVGPMTTYFSGAGDAVIDLGEGNGQLIAPVQVDGGKWFYHWDISGDGTAKDQDDTGQPKDYVLGWRLHDIFRNDVNGDVGPGTSETYRYATLNGIPLALPTIGLKDDVVATFNIDGSVATLVGTSYAETGISGIAYTEQAGSAIGSLNPSEGDNTINPLYDDLLAIWDAYNGNGSTESWIYNQFGTGWGDKPNISGMPTGWSSQGSPPYASASHNYVLGWNAFQRYYDLDLFSGTIAGNSEGERDSDYNKFMVALEVLGRPVIMRLPNLAPVFDTTGPVAYTENSVGIAYQANATDINQDTVVYGLGGVDAAQFNIVAATGAVTFKAVPDYETPLDDDDNNVYNITVTASDGVNTSVAQAVAIAVTNLGNINVTVSLAKVAEGDAANLVYTLTRSGDTDGELTANISMSGSATDSDFITKLVASTTQITFAAGSSTATLAVQAKADQLTEGNETVTVTVLAGQGYELGASLVAIGTIEDKLESHGTSVNINTRTDGKISVIGETDLYSIQLTAGEKYIFTLEANSPGLDTGLNLFATRSASSENLLETNNNAFKLNKNSRITYVAQETGTYYLQANGVSETSGDYVLSVSDINVPKPSRIAIPNPPTDSASPNPDIQWKYIPSRGTGEEFYLIIDAPKNSPQWTAENLPYWTDLENRSLLVDIASGKKLEQNGDQDGLRSGNIFAWDGPTVQSHVMQDLSRNTDYVYVVPTGAITGANNLTNDYYESTIYHTTNDAAGPKAISGGVIMNVFNSDIFFPVDPSWANLKLDVASSNTYSEPFILDDMPDLLWIQFDEKIRSSTGGWNQGWAAKHNDVFDGVYLKENGVAILEFDVNFDDVTHDPNQWGAPFRYPTGLLNVKTIDSEVVGGLPWVDYSALENGMWLNLHQAVSSWGGQYAYNDYVNNYEFKEGAIYTLIVDAPIEDIYFNTSDISTPLFEFSFIINPTQQQVL